MAMLAVGGLARPAAVLACYCTQPETVAVYRTDADVVIVSGTIVAREGGRGQLGIEWVFKGAVFAPAVAIIEDPSSCGFQLAVGERWVLASHVKNGALATDVCMSHARIPSEAADALIADARAVYGAPGAPPGEPAAGAATSAPVAAPGEPGSTIAADPETALPLVLGALLVGVLVLFGLIVVASRSRRRPA